MRISSQRRVFWLSSVATIAIAMQSATAADHLRLVWTTAAQDDGQNRQFEGLACAANSDHLYTTEVISSAKSSTGGEIHLLELDSTGKEFRTTEIGGRNVDSPILSFASTVASVVSLSEGGCVVLGQLDQNDEFVLTRLDDEHGVIWTKPIDTEFSGAWLRRARIVSNGIAVVGSRYSKALVAVWDMNGNLRWSKELQLNEPGSEPAPVGGASVMNILNDVASPAEDGDLLLAGTHGLSNKFGLGALKVWIGRCNSTGTIEDSRSFPGRFPSIAGPLANSTFALAYDNSAEQISHIELSMLGSDLKAIWNQQAELGALWVYQPDVAMLDSSHLVAAGVLGNNLQVRVLTSSGDTTATFQQPLPASASASPQIAVKGNRIFVALNVSVEKALGAPYRQGLIYCLELPR